MPLTSHADSTHVITAAQIRSRHANINRMLLNSNVETKVEQKLNDMRACSHDVYYRWRSIFHT